MENQEPILPEEETEDAILSEMPEVPEDCPCAEEEDGQKTPAEEAEEDTRPDVEVIGVHFRGAGKNYYFDPMGLTIKRDEHVIVETARGSEYGIVSMPNRMVPARAVVLPLRPLLRRATEEDEAHYESNREKEAEAYNICIGRIEQLRLDMKLVDVEYTFDNSNLLFYFTADGRVDFRELVKYLASVFRTRIELRQIGIRDEAKIMGGLGSCGRPFCCKTFLPDFVQVSIRMAKEQSLSLNSAKISGSCGRLMCCLRYEYDTYVEETAKMPKVDAVVETPDGDGIVTEIAPLSGICKVKLLGAMAAAQPKAYHRDAVTFKGIFKKDLPPEELAAQNRSDDDKGDRGRRSRMEMRPRKPERREHVYSQGDASQEDDGAEESVVMPEMNPAAPPAAEETDTEPAASRPLRAPRDSRAPRPSGQGGQKFRGGNGYNRRKNFNNRPPRPPKKDEGNGEGAGQGE